MFVGAFFYCLQLNVASPGEFASNSLLQWAAVLAVVCAAISVDAYFWMNVLDNVANLRSRKMLADRDKPMMQVGWCIVVLVISMVAMLWIPVPFAVTGIGCLIAAAGFAYEARVSAIMVTPPPASTPPPTVEAPVEKEKI